MKYKVVYVDGRTLRDYAGLNSEAAKSLGFNQIPKLNEIWIDKSLSAEDRKITIKHEIIEHKLMLKGKDYWDAHKIALSKEKD